MPEPLPRSSTRLARPRARQVEEVADSGEGVDRCRRDGRSMAGSRGSVRAPTPSSQSGSRRAALGHLPVHFFDLGHRLVCVDGREHNFLHLSI